MRFFAVAVALFAVALAGPFDGDFAAECGDLPPSDWGFTCSVMNNHIFTIDGNGYHPQMIGDYILMSGAGFEVQARYEWCPGHGEHYSCVTGVAVHMNGEHIAFYYDYSSDRLAKTLDSQLVEDFTSTTTAVRVLRRVPGLGFTVDVRDQQASPNYMVMARFEKDGASIIVRLFGQPLYTFAGLCGTYDECPYNDIVMRQTGEGVGWQVAANSWLVAGYMSLFEDPKYNLIDGVDNSPFGLHAPMSPYLWTPADAPTDEQMARQTGCSLYKDGRVWEACAYEEALFGNHFNFLIGLFELCAIHCNNPSLHQITGFTDERYNCSGLCDYQMQAADKLPEWIWDYKDYENSVYDLQVSETKYESEVFMIAPLGGEYTFRVTPNDCCNYGPMEKTVVVNVGCEKTVRIDADGDFDVYLDEFWLPEVQLFTMLSGDQTEDNVHVMWTITDPDGYKLDYENALYGTPDFVFHPYSLMPVFLPSKAGIYQLEALATDGCSIDHARFNVTVHCLTVDWLFESDNSDSIQWYHYSNEFTTLNVNVKHPCLTPFPVDAVTLTTDLDYLAGVPQYELVQTDVDEYLLGWTYNVSYPIMGQEWVEEGYCGCTVDDSQPTFTGTTDGAPYHIPPPGFEDYYKYWINRVEWEYDYSDHATITTCGCTLSHYYQYARSNECYLTYSSSTSSTGATFTWQATQAPDDEVYTPFSAGYSNFLSTARPDLKALADRNEFFVIGDCVGTYETAVTASDPFACNQGTDTLKFDVTCTRKPRAQSLTPCFDMPFDYNNHEFSSFRVYGDDTEELWNRESSNLLLFEENYKWFLDDVYMPSWNSINPWCAQQSYNVIPGEWEGPHTITLRASDGCSRDDDMLSFRLLCNYTVVAQITTSDGARDFDYVFGGWATWNYDASGSQASGYVDPYWWNYQVVPVDVQCTGIVPVDITLYWSPPGFMAMIDTSLFDDANFGAMNVNFLCTAFISDFCDMQTKPFTLTVRCTYTMTIAVVTMPTPIVFDPLVHWWGTFLFQDASTETDGGPPTTAYIRNIRWYVTDPSNVVTVHTGASYTFSESQVGVYSIVHEVTDGCMRKNATAMSITLSCNTNIVTASLTHNVPATVFIENLPAVYDLNANSSSMGTTEANVDWDSWAFWLLEKEDVKGSNVWTEVCYERNYYDGSCYDSLGRVVLEFLPFANSDGWVRLHLYQEEPTRYRVTLRVTDRCKSATRQLIINEDCSESTTAVIGADKTAVQFANNKFDKVCFNGHASTLPDGITWRGTTYRYEVVNAPANSLYAHVDVTYNSINYAYDNVAYDQDLLVPTPYIADPAGYKMHTHTMGNQTTSTHHVTSVFLKNLDGALTQDKFGACFRPDVPGVYDVKLHLMPGGLLCYYAASTNWRVTVTCNTAPASVAIAGPAAGVVGERLAFVGSATDSDVLTYSWSLVNDDTGADHTFFVTNRHAKDASVILYDVGNYTMSLTVSDDCTPVTTTRKFTVKCGSSSLEMPTIMSETYSYDGLGSMPLTLDVSPLVSGAVQHYDWTLVDYKPNGGQ